MMERPKADPFKLSQGSLSLFHTHTGERLSVDYRDGRGEYGPVAVSALNRILRCHCTQQVAEKDLRVIDFLNAVDRSLGGGNDIHIVSGFRSPEYNGKLVRRGQGAARHGPHLPGKAIDFRIPKASLQSLRKAALRLREGGAGTIPGPGSST